ncbi:MAG TPA: TIGR00159 family protein, partial [Bacteroidales bacterium]|nr:TIGR00159 family protein [Bacteroidales bacterium]
MTESFILPFFLTIRILDIIDILLVAFLMYQLYNLMKGTVAINIFIAIFVLYLFWLVVKALNMQLMSTLLGQVMGVGVIALIIVFQQE